MGVELSHVNTFGHLLLPNERVLIVRILRKRGAIDSYRLSRKGAEMGQEGSLLFVASLATIFPGAVIVCLGILFLIASAASGGVLEDFGYGAIMVGIVALILGCSRLMQGVMIARMEKRGDGWGANALPPSPSGDQLETHDHEDSDGSRP